LPPRTPAREDAADLRDKFVSGVRFAEKGGRVAQDADTNARQMAGARQLERLEQELTALHRKLDSLAR
jgi:hypothetical protein